MKKQIFATMLGLMCLSLAGSAIAQDKMGDSKMGDMKMQDHKMSGQKMDSKMGKMMKVCMAGLSDDEMKTAHGMMAHATKAEHAVMMKRMSMCMADKHKGMDMSKMDDKMGMMHMMSGLSKSQKMTMKKMWAKMTPEQMAVGKKMMMNCCTYGMEHGK